MKKLFLAVLAVFMISAVQAQFKFDISAGAAIPSGPGTKAGVNFSLEPKYGLPFGMVTGFRVEAALTARGFLSSDGTTESANVAGLMSYMATSDYYPLHYLRLGFQPFVGGGAGVYDMAAASFAETGTGMSSASESAAVHKFGGMARTGFEIHHFRFAIEYNFIGSTVFTYTDSQGNVGTVTSKNSYMGIKFGVLIGGGHRH